MMKRLSALSLLAALAVAGCLTTAAFAQEEDTLPFRPMYGHLKPNLRNDIMTAATPLTTWNGTFTYKAHAYHYNMVGTAPSTGTSTTVPVFLIPVKLVYKGTTTTTLDPATHKLTNGQTVEANTLASPIFQSGIDFVQGGTDLGSTQYIDAFQRGNFWGTVKSHTGYHLLLGTPTVLPELTLTVPAADGKIATEGGVKVGLADINWFDTQLQAYITAHSQIVPNSLPIFITWEAYLTQSGGCCIGGYHNSYGSSSAPQAYAYATYISKVGAFAQDVSALSHEVGEWADDPLVVNTGNPVQCGVLEVGDPEEGDANFGGFKYTLGGFTYNLQDLVYLPYFGAPTSTSNNGSLTFQGNPFSLTVCSNGG
ncbi:MAG TPA: hypothetical protein VJ999_06160 [Candidatus Sulfotelmatobacter sp.]|nr:hypothetical protein [Candidatus Sulfotelmatobacter sp.]